MVIDTHQHFWHYSSAEYGWIPDAWAAIRRDFLPEELSRLMIASGVASCVAVQARTSLQETRWLIELADRFDFIAGVVGWVDLEAADIADRLAEFKSCSEFVGVRDVIQGKPDGFMLGDDFNRGITAVTRQGLAYDLLVLERQLEETITFVDRHPQQRFVVDHLAKPRNDLAELDPWRANMLRLARRDNVLCKLSGGITELDTAWTLDALRPYFDTILEAFGPQRIMFGSNWPVQEAAGGYAKWIAAIHEWARPLSDAERERLFSGNAIEFYQLEAHP